MSDGTRDTLGNEDAVTLGKVTSSAGVALLAVLATVAGLLVLHGVDAAHATVSLDQLALSGNEGGTRRLSGTGEETTHHDSGSAKGEALDNVADVLNTAIGNARNAEAGSESADTVNGSGLGATDSHDLLGDAGRTTAHTNSETVDTGRNEGGGLLAGDDVTTNDIKTRELGLAPLDHVNLVHAVALGAVKNDDIEAGVDKHLETDLVLGTSTDGSSAEELLAVGELGSQREVLVLGQVGAGDHGDQVLGRVDNGELALLGLGENLVGLLKGDAVGGSNEVGDHDAGNGGAVVILELEVAVGNDTEKLRAQLSVLC